MNTQDVKTRFRFLAKFQNEEEEKKYCEWRDSNEVYNYFHMTSDKVWPRLYMITVFATPTKVKQIRESTWFQGDWKPDVADLATKE